ncbi:cysteine hydrolase family protein [Megalodesulfovibrio paquesii]
MIDALLVVDMQQGLFRDTRRYNPEGVTERINLLIDAMREAGRPVLFIQHDGQPGECVEPGTPGWEILPTLHRQPEDTVIRKTMCDAFYNTTLGPTLVERGIRRLCIAGCCTDFCVDTTIRVAASQGLELFVPEDGHTTASKLHLPAQAIITHHNYLWSELIVPGPNIVVEPAAELVKKITTPPLQD